MRTAPEERPVEPDPSVSRSRRTGASTPRSARLYRMLAPMTPPPMTTASVVIAIVSSQVCRLPGAASATQCAYNTPRRREGGTVAAQEDT